MGKETSSINKLETNSISNAELEYGKMLDTKSVMKMLHCCRKTLYNYRRDQQITYYQIGDKILYRQYDIDQFLRKHCIKARD